MEILIAAISISVLIKYFFAILAVAVICWLLWFLIGYFKVPEPFNTFLRGLVMLLAVVFLIDVVLKLCGQAGLISW